MAGSKKKILKNFVDSAGINHEVIYRRIQRLERSIMNTKDMNNPASEI